MATSVRVVCANTQGAAFRNHVSRYTVRHTPGIMGRIQEAKEALRMTFDWAEVFKVEAEQMINTPMATNLFEMLIKAVWPEKWAEPTDKWRKPQHEHWDNLQGLFKSADTQENIRGTVWAGYQSIVEYLDWQIPVTGTEDAAEIDKARATRSFGGAYEQLKIDTFKYCREIVAAQ